MRCNLLYGRLPSKRPIPKEPMSTIRDHTTGKTASVEARTQTPSRNALNVQIGPGDPISNIPVIVDWEHHQVHEGETHAVQYYTATVADIKFALVVPTYSVTVLAPHLVIEAGIYGGAGQIDVYEGATYTGGTLMTAWNRNRNSVVTPGLQIYSGVTSANGTLMPWTSFFASAEKTAQGARSASEFILKSNTTYRVDFTELAAATRLVLRFEWYEDLGV